MKIKSLLLSTALFSMPALAQQAGLNIQHLSSSHSLIQIQDMQKYILLPIEEKAPEATVNVLLNAKIDQSITVRLAVNKVDYYVPFLLDGYKGQHVILDVQSHAGRAQTRNVQADACWNEIKLSNTFDTTNREIYRPDYHFTPAYGWMNDPNGMIYKDGEWHLYYQYNPYASVWGNMHWGHAVSRDLINWEHLPVAIAPDALGAAFSGSCVVDPENTSGFGKDAIIAMYTSAGASQMQSLAYSTDQGRTFTKYACNPVLTSDIPDFRDPNPFWNPDIQAWNLILACGQEMRLYSSPNLKDWKEESRFGSGYGGHGGVWECPDLFKLTVENGKMKGTEKWVLVCNINPGGPNGGSATQYFIGNFDGHTFTCDDPAPTSKWMDYGKDHYATVSFYNAPENRRTVLAWMSNWDYANIVPTQQYRSQMSIARDLFLYEANGQLYVGSRPAKEYTGKGLDQEFKVKGSCTLTFSNPEGQQAVLTYDQKTMTLSFDRSQSGETNFAPTFNHQSVAPVHKPLTSLRVFVDKSSIEVFGNDGEVVMTNLVFPKSALKNITIK